MICNTQGQIVNVVHQGVLLSDLHVNIPLLGKCVGHGLKYSLGETAVLSEEVKRVLISYNCTDL